MTRDYTYQPHRQQGRHRVKLSLRTLILILLLAINLAVFIYHGDPRSLMPTQPKLVPQTSIITAPLVFKPIIKQPDIAKPAPIPEIITTTVNLGVGQTVAQTLGKVGIATPDISAAITSLQPLVNFRRLKPGDQLKACLNQQGQLLSLDVCRSPTDQIRTEKKNDTWQASRLDIPVTKVRTLIRGQIQTSLWEAIGESGEDPSLAIELAEIFAWDIDFYSDLQPGDSFAVLVDKNFVEDKAIGFDAIIAAYFITNGSKHEAFLFKNPNDPSATASYYDSDGKSLRKQLLRTPLKYGRVTSGFGLRKHPILGYSRAHNGIDYGVPVGTKVFAVGDGKVTRTGWRSGYGKYVQIRHANGWASEYGHLSKILIKTGQKVSQKDIIALTGNTGLSTGPHLHYGLMKNGSFVNPALQQFKRGNALKADDLQQFHSYLKQLRLILESGPLASEIPAHLSINGKIPLKG
ncbi:MAG: M23 family metallopeptidase [Deltaproteobacteria bacterium]|nr:M23 family metallopeptidase [Deltaproteobacteria bacterium]